MALDIGDILNSWPYEPGQVTARKIHGSDGREKIQLRLDLGLLQMETDGRPDGKRPHGFESLLEYYEHLRRKHIEQTGSDEGFELDEQACELLRSEGVMYYHRYLAAFVLEDYEAVERDSMRNLRLFDVCNNYAQEEPDKYVLEQYRPYVIMMIARARARMALRHDRPKTALAATRKGIKEIEESYRRLDQDDAIETSGEIAILRAMATEIQTRVPVHPLKRLRDSLAKAVAEERYEDAAALRDQISRATSRPGRDGRG